MLRLKVGLAALAMLAGILPALASATLTPNGVVMINRGNGFEQVSGPTQVGPNDMVMVNEGSANMSYADGSSTALQPGQVYTVGNVGLTPAGTGLAGAGAGGGGGLSTTALVVGGVVVAGGAAAAIAASQGGSKSSSP